MQFFDRMADDLGNRLMSLNSLWNPYYFARSGFYTALGFESAQGLPNPQVRDYTTAHIRQQLLLIHCPSQISCSFLRGAAKQYGTWTWSSVSIFKTNRWGYKTCAMQKNTTSGGDR
jgi:hypothetical protein